MIEVEIDERQALAGLADLMRRLVDQRPALEEIGELMVERTRGRFRDGTGPDGTAWEPLSAVTLARREKAGVSGTAPGIGESRQLSTQWFAEVGDESVLIGSPMIQAGVFHFGAEARSFTGGKTPWGDIPARPVLGVSDDDGDDIVAILREYLAGG